jgi:hypothetical protein
VQTLVFDPDGARLASGSSDGSAFWDVDPESWTRVACEIANRDLTEAEWGQLIALPYEPVCSR